MNEMKRELIKVAGDMSESEARVKAAVEKCLKKKKRTMRPLVAIVAAATVLFMFLQFQTNETTATLPPEEYAYYLHYESTMWDRELEDSDKQRALTRLLERIGRMEYGKSLGLSVSKAEIDARMEQNKYFTEQTEYEAMMEKVLNEANISKKTYEEKIESQQIESSLMGDLLVERLQTEYTQMNGVMARHMMNHYAVNYMESHYEEEITAFRTQYQIEQQHHTPTSMMGVIGLVEGNMFYLIQDAIGSDIQGMTREELLKAYGNNDKAAWYPNVDKLTVTQGDIVRVWSGVSGTEGGHRVGMNYGDAEILQGASSPNLAIRLTGEQEQQFTAYLATLDLEENIKVSMARLPDYTVTANGVTYSIWEKYNKSGLEIIRHDPNGYVSLTKSQAAPLYELLQ